MPERSPTREDAPQHNGSRDGLVSVIVPAFNAAAFVEDALASILDSSYTQLEVIAVDDGSTDNTASLIEKRQDPRVRLIRQENQGLAATRNRALDVARGEFIQLLDADDLLEPNKIARHVTYLRAHPSVDVVYGRTLQFRGDVRDIMLSRTDAYPPPSDYLFAILRDELFPPHAPLFRASLFVAGAFRFDERMRACQDLEWLARMAAHDVRFEAEDQLSGYYRLHAGQKTRKAGEFSANLGRLFDIVREWAPESAIRRSHVDAAEQLCRIRAARFLALDGHLELAREQWRAVFGESEACAGIQNVYELNLLDLPLARRLEHLATAFSTALAVSPRNSAPLDGLLAAAVRRDLGAALTGMPAMSGALLADILIDLLAFHANKLSPQLRSAIDGSLPMLRREDCAAGRAAEAIDSTLACLGDEQAWLYGAGKYAMRALTFGLLHRERVTGLVDDDPRKAGMCVGGVTVHESARTDVNGTPVIVCTEANWERMADQARRFWQGSSICVAGNTTTFERRPNNPEALHSARSSEVVS